MVSSKTLDLRENDPVDVQKKWNLAAAGLELTGAGTITVTLSWPPGVVSATAVQPAPLQLPRACHTAQWHLTAPDST